MVNMKVSPEEAKEEYSDSAMADAPEYPYGLCISLDDEALKKLGISELPQIGQVMSLAARVEVKSASGYKTMKGDIENRVELQITDMQLGSELAHSDPANKLYGGS